MNTGAKTIALASLFALAGCAATADNPTADNSTVGSSTAAHAAALPDPGINPAPPVIPAGTFSLADFGGNPDGKTLNTDAFKKAIAAITQAGGGHLNVPPGVYKTLPFTIVSHMDLHLSAGAVIRFPDTLQEYGIPDPNQPRTGGGGAAGLRATPLIGCPNNSTDVMISGTGVIDGSGAIFWAWSDKASRRYPPGRTIVARPVLVNLPNIQRLHVTGVTLMNSPMYQLVPRGSDILIDNVRIVAPSDAPNTDAINVGGQRIIVRHCEIDTGDDNVAIQSGSHDVLIEDLTCLHGHGISIGSPTLQGLSHIFVRRCTFDGTDNGLRIKSYRGRGGDVHDIWYSDIVMKNVRRPFDINMLYNGNANVSSDVGPRVATPGQTEAIPHFHDIHVTNLTVTRSPLAGRILGLPEQMAHDITFRNVTFETDRGFLLQDAKDVVFDNVKITPQVGEPLVLDNGSVKWNGQEKSGTSGGPADVFYPGD